MSGNEKSPLNQAQRKQFITALSNLFPNTFSTQSDKKKPLKIGIGKDIALRFPEISKREISKMLHHYTQKTRYQVTLLKGAPRYDLDGNHSGFVSDTEHTLAKREIKKYARKAVEAKKKAAEKRRARNLGR